MLARTKTIILAALALCLVAGAEQIRVVVPAPVVVGETNGMGGQAALWQALITAELSRQSSVAVLEREDLPQLATERALTAGHATNSNVTSGWLGADCVVLTQWQVKNGTNRLALKILNVGQGGIDKEFTREFTDDQMAAAANDLAKELRAIALELLSQREIHTTVSVLDFESQSRFERGRWQEHALARQLRDWLKQQPGVLVLEREEVEELLRETRLQRGGLAAASTALTNSWAALRHYPLVSGTIDETQPEGSPLTLRITTQVRDLGNGRTNAFTESFPIEQWADGVGKIEQELNASLHQDDRNAASPAAAPDRSVEAMALVEKAVKVGNSRQFSNFKEILRHCPDGLVSDQLLRYLFNEGGYVGRQTAGRRASLLQAVLYLKAAMLADDRNPKIKLFLASLLVDSQVNDRTLAVELAEEVGWQFPEQRLSAWGFVYFHAAGDRQEHYRRLLAEQFPDSRFAKIPEQAALAQFLEKHRNDADLTELVDALRPAMDQALAKAQDGTWIEGEVHQLFQLTQITGRNPKNRQKGNELQTPDNRARGAALLEAMVAKHPRHAFFLFHFWSYYWDYYTDSDENICLWYQRAADAVPGGPSEKWGMSVWWDKPRIELARRWMAAGKFQDALPYLEKITNGHLEGERDLRIGQCAFETGDFARALKLFRAFGPDNPEAAAWAAKCEQKLDLPPLTFPPKAYAVVTNHAPWRVAELKLPAQTVWTAASNGRSYPMQVSLGEIHAVAADADYLWFGLIPPHLQFDENLLEMERVPEMMRRAENQGGLVRWNRITGETRLFTPKDGLPHRWVWTLATTPEGVWVGTLGGGLGLLNSKTDRWSIWTETNGLPMNFVRSLCPDGDQLWVGLGKFDRGGVVQLSQKTGRLWTILPSDFPAKTNFPPAHLLKLPNVPEELKRPFVISYVPVTAVSLLKVMADRLWCVLPGRQSGSATAGFEPHGTVVFDRTTNGWFKAADDVPGSIVRVKDGAWLSLGGGGLASGNLQGGDWQRITSADGLPMATGPLSEWHGRLLIAGDGLMVLDETHKRFEVYPFPTPGGAEFMTVTGDQVYLVRGNQILSLDLATLPHSIAATP